MLGEYWADVVEGQMDDLSGREKARDAAAKRSLERLDSAIQKAKPLKQRA